ncbi:shikimate dehydrogenase [Lentibacillus amyloliquefaciens]|uniref:Shikimate dehydrogenase (NADP(+)) n=1 Tax=Lentibacillus amyloliquefaciens TaxID=1472767 RepID=A0A0U3W4L3_9BACI|nr:shikimate dehydrogenase [Lentibacillus amyloliquefaciens]ALX48146.1 shikimate dehydrogenase [Lentibacillus amyloliquefaciens]
MHYKLGLIGYPVQNSLSPWIHEQFLKKADIGGNYALLEINPKKSFENELQQIKNNHYDGFNVTVPYKKQIIPFLDDLDDGAHAIGAVNTVAWQNGKWVGYNTDGKGYVTALGHAHPSIFQHKQCRILLIGAGGAARGIFYELAEAGFRRIDIANRTQSSAEDIASLGDGKAKTSILTLKEAENNLKMYDLIIQTTNIGMKPNVNDAIISLEQIDRRSIVSDIVYQPIETHFLQQASRIGASVHHGHTMLLYQAQYAFEIWTSKKVPADDLNQPLQSILEGR